MPKRYPKLTIEQVKQKYEMDWIQIPGVEGVGITEQFTKKIIVVYTSDKTLTQKKIPAQIEGYKVIIKYTGELQAY